MTRKELQDTKLRYRRTARAIIHSEDAHTLIAATCESIALEPCYNHHERGQRLWAFFTALEEEKKKYE